MGGASHLGCMLGRMWHAASRASMAAGLVLIALAMNTSDAAESPSSCAAKTRVVSDLCSEFGEQTPACTSSRKQLAAGCGTKAGMDRTRLGDTNTGACKGIPSPIPESVPNKVRFSAQCKIPFLKCKKSCRRLKCKKQCSKKQCHNGNYKAVRPLKDLQAGAWWAVKVLGGVHFAVCPMYEN